MIVMRPTRRSLVPPKTPGERSRRGVADQCRTKHIFCSRRHGRAWGSRRALGRRRMGNRSQPGEGSTPMAFRIARHLALTSRTPSSASNCSVGTVRGAISDGLRTSRVRPRLQGICSLQRPATSRLRPEADRSNSTERARTDCLRKRECATTRSFRKRCLRGVRHQAALSARKPNPRERASKLTPLRYITLRITRLPFVSINGF